MKFVDNLPLAEAINVKDCVLPNPSPPRPLSYNARTVIVLPTDQTPVQGELNGIVQYRTYNTMKMNADKTKLDLFNTAYCKKIQFYD